MRFGLAIAGLLILAFMVQEFLPVFDWAYSARLLLVHTAFLAVALTVPYPAMLATAFATGFLWDARYYVPVYSSEPAIGNILTQAEIPFGFTIFVFGITGTLVQGVRPFFRRGRWELPVLMIGLSISLGMMLEYLAISFHRGGLEIPPELWWKLLMTGLFSSLVSPFLLLWLARVAARTRFRLQEEGAKRRHSYDGDAR